MDDKGLLKLIGIVAVGFVATIIIGANMITYKLTKNALNKYGGEQIKEERRLMIEDIYKKVFPFYYVDRVCYNPGAKIAFRQYDKKHRHQESAPLNRESGE